MSAEPAYEGAVRDPEILPRLLASLWGREWSGLVVVKSGDVERRLYLSDGRVQTAVSNDPAETLTALLVADGALGSDDVGRAAQHLGAADRGWSFAKKLVGLGLVDEPTLHEAEARRVVALAERILSSRSGLYRCEVGPPPAEMVPQALEVPQLIATAVLNGWDDTWAMNALGGMGAVLRLRPEALPAHEATGADEAYDLTLLRCDGRRTLREVLEGAPLPELAAVKFLAACRLLGSLEPVEFTQPRPAPALAQAPSPAVAPSREPSAGLPASAPPAAAIEPEDEAESTAPGYYRPSAGARPQPRRSREPAAPEVAESGSGRWWLLVLLIVLLGAVGWFGWVGFQQMEASEPDTPAAGPDVTGTP